MSDFLKENLPVITDYAIRIGGVIVLFIVALWIAKRVQALVERRLARSKLDKTLTGFFGRSARFLIMLLVGLAALSIFGIETTSFAAVIGASALAVGLAFQGTLSNFAAGVMLLIFRPFKVDEVITVAGQTGKVREIGLFATTLGTPDRRRIIVPNSTVFGATIVNITHENTRRVDMPVGVDYSADIDTTRKVLEGILPDLPGLDEPGKSVFLAGLGASSVNWEVRVWCQTDDYFKVWEAGLRAIKYALDAAGIGIPYPQMDVHLDTSRPLELSKSA